MHKAKNCVLNCIDFRIQEAFFEWLSSTHNLGKSDIIEVAGSTKDIVAPINSADKIELLRNIDISVKLHNPDTIILVDHQDCGGYAQDGTIPSGLNLQDDLKAHQLFIDKAIKTLQSIYPDKAIKAYYVPLNGSVVSLS